MKKPFRFNELSSMECAVLGCGALIKMNVLARKDPDQPIICHRHWKKQRVLGFSTREIPWRYHLERRPYAARD